MRRAYKTWKPGSEALDMVRQANLIVRDYANQGYDLTLRQLYYQFVARDLIANNQRSYKRLGTIIDRARLAGLIDWSAIVDRTRNLAGGDNTTNNPADVLRSYASYADVSRWDNQPTRVEVWVEKEALAGVIERVAAEWHVPYFCCRGYVSQSEMHEAGNRIGRHLRNGNNVLLLHLGDHDPSGIDMTRDIKQRLTDFVTTDWLYDQMPGRESASMREIGMAIKSRLRTPIIDPPPYGYGFEVRRIALNMDQIEEYAPPPNPTKFTDSRAEDYLERFGYDSWELDALEPSVLAELVSTNIEPVIDEVLWSEKEQERDELREQYARVADNWATIQEDYR